MTKRFFCRNCRKTTEHQYIRVSAFGGVGESAGSRILTGLFTGGMSELFAESYYECGECGATK